MKTLVGSLLNLMEDPDKDVRVAFSDCIKNILESLDSEEGFIKEVNSCLFVGFVLTYYGFCFTNVKHIDLVLFSYVSSCLFQG